MIQCKVNGIERAFDGDPEMPLLWYLRDLLQLTGIKYGCGMGLCGACTRAYGDGLNIAARVQALADPGGICVTALVREEVSARTSLAFEALGAQRLKNIPRPVRVFRVRLGDQGESVIPPPVVPHGAPRAWRRSVLLGLLAVGLVGILGLGVRLALYRGPSVDRPRLSIAVLPFSNLSGDPGQDYFSDALTEDLTTDLSRIEGAFVIARNTMQTYRGKAVDVKQLGRELGVRYLLEGSVRRAEQQARAALAVLQQLQPDLTITRNKEDRGYRVANPEFHRLIERYLDGLRTAGPPRVAGSCANIIVSCGATASKHLHMTRPSERFTGDGDLGA
jgi:2Fe-2S iron-sulfur cluster binding domain